MRTVGAFLLALTLGAGVATISAPAAAKGKARKTARAGADDSPAPSASGAEVNKLKAVSLGDPKAGFFKWGMKPEEVMALVRVAVEKKYEPRIKQATQDPGKQQRIREELNRELNAVKKSYAKFEGDKSNWDVSIVGPEFQRNSGEAMLVTKDELWTRYFFFFEDGLYKMFLAFNKDAIEGKSFTDFGKSMEARYGRAKEVYRDEKMKGGVRHILDHYDWGAGSDRLRLVDRSEFYGVYCLVLFDGNTQDRVIERRKVVGGNATDKDSLVEAVTAKDDASGRDANDNIIDRVTGREVKKPGDEEKHADIYVPSPTKAGPSEVNTKTPASSSDKESGSSKKKGKKSDSPLDGLEL